MREDLSKIVIEIFKKSNQTLSIAESCTGGLLSYQFTKISGASNVFVGSVVSYQNLAKMKILGVKKELLDLYSPYSNEVIEAMLQGIMNLTDSTFGLATSGLASGSNFRDIKVGDVFIGFKERNKDSIIIKKEFKGSREEVQLSASNVAIELLYNNIDKKY
ncbi:CinA family protein [Helicobacter sp. MIT 99-5507]|uniref:CinA family protein n=1 Tax=Helicobacter sp. MIT 99-5507 TaxID=152489 RepID=UPI000E1F5FC9|nr:CinA family protein [Helicobacter sp. MIT 99-5507]RDU57430.1 hypothetical protein CQA42_05765 [Helicobacter sp. MIT 99-5507]